MRWIVLSDSHFAQVSKPKVAAARDRVFGAVLRQVSAENADGVFITGDTTHRGRRAELTRLHELADVAGVTLTAVVGNHDADTHTKAELAPFFLGGRPSAAPDALYRAFSEGGVRWLLLDTAREMMSAVDYSGYVSPDQQAWLADEIRRANADPAVRYVCVLGHHPIANTTRRSDEPGLNIADSDPVRAILGTLRGKTGLYLCGHTHCHSIHIGTDGWHYAQTGALLLVQSYREMTVDARGLRIETVDVDMSDPALREDWAAVCAGFEDPFTLYPREAVYGAPADLRLEVGG